MNSGKGLESLIPPSKNQGNNNQGNQSNFQDTNAGIDNTPKNAKQEINESFETNQESELDEKPEKQLQKSQEEEAVFQIEVDKIKPNPYQPRKEYNQENLRELANSIREVGIIQPLVVSKIEKETNMGITTEYQLISGERRLRASKLVGLERVPVIIRNLGQNKDKLSVALVENIQRDDLNPVEKARGYSRLQDEFNLTQREVATKVGKSRSSVANTLRLLNLPSEMQDALSRGDINESQARLLLSLDDPRQQDEAFQKLLENKINTKELRSNIKKRKSSSGGSSSNNNKGRQDAFWENQLEEKFGTPVEILKKNKGGKLTIKFFSEEEWRSILDKLLEN